MYWDFWEIAEIMAKIWIFIHALWLVSYLLKSWWLYMINTRLWEDHAWLSWVPIVNIYMWARAADKSFVTYIVYPSIGIFVWAFLMIFTFWISLLIAIIYFIYKWVQICNGISKRTKRWSWSTIWLLFIPAIMLPVIGYKLEEQNQSKENINDNVEEK